MLRKRQDESSDSHLRRTRQRAGLANLQLFLV